METAKEKRAKTSPDKQPENEGSPAEPSAEGGAAEEMKGVDSQSAKSPGKLRSSRPARVDMEALRRDAGRQLQERLQKGELSTPDLLKVMAFTPPEPGEKSPRSGDWVLVLQGGES